MVEGKVNHVHRTFEMFDAIWENFPGALMTVQYVAGSVGHVNGISYYTVKMQLLTTEESSFLILTL